MKDPPKSADRDKQVDQRGRWRGKRKRREDNLRDASEKDLSQMPNVLEIQTAIAEAGRHCGKPRRSFASKLPDYHPAVRDLEQAMANRSLENDYLAKFLWNREVFRCREKSEETDEGDAGGANPQ